MKAASKKIKIIFEDNHLLVVEKPVNIPTQEDESKDLDLLTLLKEDIKERFQKPGNVFLGLVHRLDRPVGGAMVFGKTSKAASRLSDQVRKRDFNKTYLAVIHGIPEKFENRLEHYLLKNTSTNMVSVVSPSTNGAKNAILEYTVLDSKDSFSLVKVKLHTGRPHQIRVQFSAIGHPLFGDQRYGTKQTKPGQQIALWSSKVSFKHPTKEETLTFLSTPPDEYPWSLFEININAI